MNDETPNTTHAQGVHSAVDATPGALVATVLVYLTSWTAHPMDALTAAAVVGLGSLASSYIVARLRRLRKVSE